MLRQHALDELFAELEETQNGLLDATLDDRRTPEPLSLTADEAELAGGFRAKLALTPCPYQSDALAAWRVADSRGVVALPTGAGKTILALMAIKRTGLPKSKVSVVGDGMTMAFKSPNRQLPNTPESSTLCCAIIRTAA